MQRWALGVGVMAMMVTLATGCGPVTATQRISEAEVALERARVADAQTGAPFEYYSATHFLTKAKEEWGYSDFQAATDYATTARRSAEAALRKAKEDPYTGSPVPKEKLRTVRAKSRTAKPRDGMKRRRGSVLPKDTLKEAMEEKKKKDQADILDDPNGMDDDE